MIDEALARLSRLATSDPEGLVEDLRRVYEHGRATAPEGARYETVLRRLEEYRGELAADRVAREQALAGLPPPPRRSQSAEGPAAAGSDALLEQLGEARALLLRHPAAAHALAHAVMRMGRRFAATEEGRQWVERLRASPAVERVHLCWDQLTLGLVGDPEDGDALDLDQLLDALLTVAERPDREELLRYEAPRRRER